MGEEIKEAAIVAEIKMEDGVLVIAAKVDIIEAIKVKAKESDNTYDDMFVSILEMAEKGLDWKGFAKELL